MTDRDEPRPLCAGEQEAREDRARLLFQHAWQVPRDTYITGDIPLLLTKLSLIPDPDRS